MKKIFIFSFFLLSILSQNVDLRTLEGIFKITNSLRCPTQPNKDYLSVKVIDSAQNITQIETWNGDGNNLLANCTGISSQLSCGVLSTVYACKKVGLFEKLNGSVTLIWDNNQESIPFDLKFNYTQPDNTVTECVYSGNTSPLKLPDNSWTVKSCDCPACCYKIGSTIKVRNFDIIQNRPRVTISGDLDGNFCQNTLSDNDFCLANSTFSTLYLNNTVSDSIVTCNSTTCGVKDLKWYNGLNYWNESGNWLNISWTSGSRECLVVAQSGFGEKITMWVVLAIALLWIGN